MLFRCKMLKLHLGISLCVFTLPCLVTADDQDGSAFLLYCNVDIHNFSLASGTDSLLMSGMERPFVVDYHMKGKVFFWTDNNTINKAPLWQEGARPTVLRSGVNSKGLAVDWIHNLIFWTEYYNNAIGVSRLDGSMVRTVLQERGINPYAIVLNPAEGFMFWSDWGVPKKIERCDMNGTNRKVIVKEDISIVHSLAIDLDSQRVFWTDIGKDSLSSANFDGNQRRNLNTQLKTPTSIEVNGQHVYFVTRESGHRAVYKASKVDGSGFSKIFDGKEIIYNLKIYHPSKQLEGSIIHADRTQMTALRSTTNEPSTKLPSSYLPVTVPQTNFNSTFEENKNAVATIGTCGTHLILAVVIASVAFIAMVGMLIYIRHLLTRTVANAGNPYPVQGGNYDKYMYMEGPL